MTLYAESSAVLFWLLGEPLGDEAGRLLASASTMAWWGDSGWAENPGRLDP